MVFGWTAPRGAGRQRGPFASLSALVAVDLARARVRRAEATSCAAAWVVGLRTAISVLVARSRAESPGRRSLSRWSAAAAGTRRSTRAVTTLLGRCESVEAEAPTSTGARVRVSGDVPPRRSWTCWCRAGIAGERRAHPPAAPPAAGGSPPADPFEVAAACVTAIALERRSTRRASFFAGHTNSSTCAGSSGKPLGVLTLVVLGTPHANSGLPFRSPSHSLAVEDALVGRSCPCRLAPSVLRAAYLALARVDPVHPSSCTFAIIGCRQATSRTCLYIMFCFL